MKDGNLKDLKHNIQYSSWVLRVVSGGGGKVKITLTVFTS